MQANFEFETTIEGCDYYVVATLTHDEHTEMYERGAVDFEIFAVTANGGGYRDLPEKDYSRGFGDKVARAVWEHNYDQWVASKESRGDR